MTMPPQLWIFRARLTRVIDGDTVDVEIDAGFHATRVERLRLLGLNAPEVHGASRTDGLWAAAYVREWLPVGPDPWPLVVQTMRTDVFGRYLATLWRTSDGAELNADLLETGHAVPYPDK